MTKAIAYLTLCTLLAVTSASAQAPAGTDPPKGAGAAGVDLATFHSRNRARIMRADADHDGRVSRAEWAAWWDARPGKGPYDPAGRFRAIDADGDGFLTADEIDATSSKRFARLDADHDGRVVRAERPCRAK
ncbi:EF-hand domain-containing protein [Methylobacterium sp. J-068]|uniref:EF-hand domain-containing protein n=1 Tax=Methylobacterium sp. J-068 TaxID=2836649 RepID=UPI001FB9F466|nr:acid-shock protein [Methylobacterium sp. J-068]MCJ2036000.1 acid-shock protein [Methylobacterium sp. J-068]